MPQPKQRPRRNRSKSEDDFPREARAREARLDAWIPKTELGKKVKNSEIGSLSEVFEKGLKIKEPQIIDFLVSELREKTMDIKKTARVTSAGRQFSYRATVLVGTGNGFVGVGIASDHERLSAVQKASSQAKLHLVSVHRGCGSWECRCGTTHSLPFKTHGRCGSVRVKLIPAPKGVGLVVGENVKDVFRFAGVHDIWSQTRGQTPTRLNFVRAAIDALHQTTQMKISESIQRKTENVGMDRT